MLWAPRGELGLGQGKVRLLAWHREMSWVQRTFVKLKRGTCQKPTKCGLASRSLGLSSRGRVSVRIGLGLS